MPFFIWGQSVGIHFFGNYFEISNDYFIWSFALLFLLFWMIYKLTAKFLFSVYLTWLHVLLTLIVLDPFITGGLWFFKILAQSKMEATVIQQLLNNQPRELTIALPVTIIFVVGQLAFIINLFVGIIKRAY